MTDSTHLSCIEHESDRNLVNDFQLLGDRSLFTFEKEGNSLTFIRVPIQLISGKKEGYPEMGVGCHLSLLVKTSQNDIQLLDIENPSPLDSAGYFSGYVVDDLKSPALESLQTYADALGYLRGLGQKKLVNQIVAGRVIDSNYSPIKVTRNIKWMKHSTEGIPFDIETAAIRAAGERAGAGDSLDHMVIQMADDATEDRVDDLYLSLHSRATAQHIVRQKFVRNQMFKVMNESKFARETDTTIDFVDGSTVNVLDTVKFQLGAVGPQEWVYRSQLWNEFDNLPNAICALRVLIKQFDESVDKGVSIRKHVMDFFCESDSRALSKTEWAKFKLAMSSGSGGLVLPFSVIPSPYVIPTKECLQQLLEGMSNNSPLLKANLATIAKSFVRTGDKQALAEHLGWAKKGVVAGIAQFDGPANRYVEEYNTSISEILEVVILHECYKKAPDQFGVDVARHTVTHPLREKLTTTVSHFEDILKKKPLSFSDVVKKARALDAKMPVYAKVMAQNKYSVSWTPSTPPVAVSDLTFHSLHSKEMLRAEGELQKHCSHSYVSRVIKGDCFIFSVRDQDSKTQSTLEIRKGQSGKYCVEQNFAKGNTAVSSDVTRATETFLQRVNDGEIILKGASEFADSFSAYSAVEKAIAITDIDFTSPAIVSKAVSFLSGHLPRGVTIKELVGDSLELSPVKKGLSLG